MRKWMPALGIAAFAGAAVTGWAAITSADGAALPFAQAAAVVCAGADRLLRIPDEGRCAAGSQLLPLTTDDDSGLCDDCDGLSDTPKPPDPDRARRDKLAELERRLEALEKSSLFEVVRKDGQPVFTVGPGITKLYNQGSVAVAAVSATDSGGFFTGKSADGQRGAVIGASGTNVGVRVLEGGITRVDLGSGTGRHSLRVLSASGAEAAGIGTARTGTGAVVVRNKRAELRASLTIDPNKHVGLVAIVDASGGSAAALTEATSGGGFFEIGSTESASAVKMGSNGNRYGIVLAGPVLGLPLIPKSGLPGSYLLGCGAVTPPACVPAR